MAPRTDLSAFDGVALFAAYDGRALAPLAAHADRVAVLPGVILAREGHQAREVLVILSGEVLVSRGDRPLDLLGPGAVIGAREELDRTPHGATYVAGSGVAALALPGHSFRWAVQTLPGLAPALGLTAAA